MGDLPVTNRADVRGLDSDDGCGLTLEGREFDFMGVAVGTSRPCDELFGASAKAQISCTQPLERWPVGADNIGIKSLSGCDQPGVILAQAAR